MRRTIAILTSSTLSIMLACGPKPALSNSPLGVEVLKQEHNTEHGFEADVTVSKASDGTVISTAVVDDPTTGDQVQVRTDGTTVTWDGFVGGEPARGTSAATDLAQPGSPPQPLCFHPVAAIVCVGVGLALLAGCAFGFSCDGGPPPTPTVPPGGAGGTPGGGEGEPEEGDDGSSDGGTTSE